jgi:sec-independent protein translocase protein TatC
MPLLLPRPNPGRNASDNPDEYRLTLFEHLEELRDRIVRSIVAVAVATTAGWFLQPIVYAYIEGMANTAIKAALSHRGVAFSLVFHNATDPFMLKMRLSVLIGLVLVFPFLIVQIWGFVAPGLKSSERRPFKMLAPYSVVLFFVGAGFCWAIMPQALTWFVSYFDDFQGTVLMQEAGTMTFFVLKMIAAFGLGFQLPLVVYGLALAGLLTGEALMQNWRQAATGIFIAAMVITPSNDLFSMLMMAIPLVILFGASVVAVRLLEKKRGKLAKTDDYPLE